MEEIESKKNEISECNKKDLKNKDDMEVQLNKNLNKEIKFDDKIIEDKQIKNKRK